MNGLAFLIYRWLQRIHHREDSLTFPFGGARGDFIHLSNGTHYVLRRSVSADDAAEMDRILCDPDKARLIPADQIDTSGLFVRPVRGFDF
jgi:hypothetical protein